MPAAGILEYIIPLLYLPVFTIWVSATKQASHTLNLSTAWVSATKQASHTLILSTAWVSATKQASHTHKLFTLRRKKGTDYLDPISCAHVEAKEWAQAELVLPTAALRYEPCTQFINVSQRTLHIYFIDGCRVCPLDARYKNRTK